MHDLINAHVAASLERIQHASEMFDDKHPGAIKPGQNSLTDLLIGRGHIHISHVNYAVC